jgi:hypothetical protein
LSPGAEMKLWIVPLFAIGVVAGSHPGDEPNEIQMRAAFEGSLAAQVRNALDFAREAGGDEAVIRIRENGMDRFTLNAFQKLNCRAQNDGETHVCEFAVDVGLVNGPLQKTISGRFIKSPDGLVFTNGV